MKLTVKVNILVVPFDRRCGDLKNVSFNEFSLLGKQKGGKGAGATKYGEQGTSLDNSPGLGRTDLSYFVSPEFYSKRPSLAATSGKS